MLVRNAGRKQRRETARALAASFAQLNLPWLAPAQLRWNASQAAATSQTTPRARRRSRSQPHSAPAQSRALATAADQRIPAGQYPGQYPLPAYSTSFRNPSQDSNIPWDLTPSSKAQLSNLRPYYDPVIINTSIQNPALRAKVSHGIHGTAVDLLQHLHTALQVGRLSRAEAIIQRIGDICSAESTELRHAHTAYLEESLRVLARHGRGEEGTKVLQTMQKWFEVEIRSKGVSIDTKMLVVMIRASIRAFTGSQRDRTVRRYLEMARELGVDEYYEALQSEDYDDNEFTILGRTAYGIQPSEIEEKIDPEPEKVLGHPQARREDVLPSPEIPEVLPTPQRGDGLAGIKRALQDFMANPSLPADAPIDEQLEQAFNRQRIIEETSVEVAIDRWRKSDEELRKIGIHTAMQTKPIGALMWQWHQALLPALKAELDECKKLSSTAGKDADRRYYGPYLELLSLEKVAANTILYVMSSMASGKNHATKKYEPDVKLASITMGLARAIEQECTMEASQKKYQANHHGARSQGPLAKPASKKRSKAQQEKQALLAQLEWPLEAKIKLGAMLISKLIEAAQLPVTRSHPRTNERITQLQPAFLHRFKYEKGKKFGMLSSNPALLQKIESEPLGSVIAKRMPMVVQPKPWKGWNDGGYLHYSSPIIRLPFGDHTSKDYFIAAHKNGDMGQIYAGLTALGAVPWKIHHGVFKVQVEAWNSGEAIANFAPLHPTFDVPPEPEKSDSLVARHKWLHHMRDLENKRSGLHSKRCFQNFQLEIARTMVNETLYFPHNMDFRGRAYPIPPYLNHMGADNVRGLLVFAEGKPLGPDGLRWLKIHLATVAGYDKASMQERVEFTEQHLDDIYDSVRNPLDGRRWWLKAEDGWQTLAACFELTEALDSPDPSKFISHLPIQQDGTCNGLQHYAALGGDKIGAAQVNLEPSDRPADVYTAVAEAVKAEVRRDAALGNPVALKLNGNITRKCVKQPVMTNVYGVTWFGAKEQVQRQLENIFPVVQKYDEVNYSRMSQYIATKIFKSLGSMFGGAQAIQTWLGQCADRISTCITPEQIEELTAPLQQSEKVVKKTPGRKSKAKKPGVETSDGTSQSDRSQHKAAKPLFKSTVTWTTPLRLLVVQPYRTMGQRIVQTSLQSIVLQDPQIWHPVSKRKQLQAFPPNFIHSLDATHMLLSALKCRELGITFASIHDSFWTHACDVDRMSRVLRDAFIEMHKDNVVGRLREEFQTRYQGCMCLASVQSDSRVGKKISALRKKGKKDGPSQRSELAIEMERLRLLKSEDPKERAKGKAMVTAGSILASEGDDSALVLPSEIAGQQLGTIPDGPEVEAVEDSAAEAVASHSGEESDLAKAEDDIVESLPRTSAKTKDAQTQAPTTAPKKQRPLYRKIFVWMPLTFPEVPPKGEFDVRKIRDSPYFFH